MHSLCFYNANATIHTLHFQSHFHFHLRSDLTPSLPFPSTHSSKPRFRCSINIDTKTTKQVTDIPKQKNKVIILWDLDNKPPYGPPYDAALSLKTAANRFGDVVGISAYTKHHAFFNLPQWAPHQNPNRKNHLCRICGREFETKFDLNNHVFQIHERQRQKRLNRLRSIKIHRSKLRFIRRNHKHNEAAKTVVAPKVGFGFASELRRAGVFVKKVNDKAYAADWLLKREMQNSMVSGGIDWLILVSDDSKFSGILRKAREANLGTVVVGDYWHKALGKHADLWVPWVVVENGKVKAIDLVLKNIGITTTESLDDGELEEYEDVADEYTTEEEDGFYVY